MHQSKMTPPDSGSQPGPLARGHLHRLPVTRVGAGELLPAAGGPGARPRDAAGRGGRLLSCADNDRPSINPEAAVRLMLAGFLAGIGLIRSEPHDSALSPA